MIFYETIRELFYVIGACDGGAPDSKITIHRRKEFDNFLANGHDMDIFSYLLV